MSDLPLNQMALGDLAHACRRETVRFQHGEASNPRYCLEIFHRALRQGDRRLVNGTNVPLYDDEEARTLLVTVYTEFIRAQINRTALPRQIHEELLQDIWRNFWRAANNGLAFDTLPGALAYLRQTAVSELIKHRRARYARLREESLQELAERTGEEFATPASDLFAEHVRARFRGRCAEVLADPLEYRVFWLRYGLGYTPKEIASRLAAAGDGASRSYTPRRVSDLLERSFRRLSEDPEIRALLQSD